MLLIIVHIVWRVVALLPLVAAPAVGNALSNYLYKEALGAFLVVGSARAYIQWSTITRHKKDWILEAWDDIAWQVVAMALLLLGSVPLATTGIAYAFEASRVGPVFGAHTAYLLSVYPLVGCTGAILTTWLLLQLRMRNLIKIVVYAALAGGVLVWHSVWYGGGLETAYCSQLEGWKRLALFMVCKPQDYATLTELTLLGMATAVYGLSIKMATRSHLTRYVVVTALLLSMGVGVLMYHPHTNPIHSDLIAYAPQSTMQAVAHHEGTTGWVSVVDVKTPQFDMRLLRADHSLIGGWHRATKESVYSSFYLMEAVRLIERSHDVEVRALQIGLGIGVSANSLQQHGVLVDVVEIDAAVVAYARTYFDLQEPHAVHVMDAAAFMVDATLARDATYDYVLHDVFTGGSLPPSLFTLEFLQHVMRVLKPNGVLALNVVGMRQGQMFHTILDTVKQVFATVEVLVEDPEASADTWMNMVIYATNLPSITFRPATVQDLLDSGMREQVLGQLSKYRVQIDTPPSPQADHDYHLALNHWNIMRQLFTLEFWKTY
jgi:spermidine synthase